MAVLRDTGCCAMKELDKLANAASPEAALHDVVASLIYEKTSFVVFSAVTTRRGWDHSDVNDATYGGKFRDFLAANGLGTTVETPEEDNPATRNGVTVWIWNVNKPALREWAVANGWIYNDEWGTWNRPTTL